MPETARRKKEFAFSQARTCPVSKRMLALDMERDPVTHLLKGVSRSFYLSLRLLPEPMRRAAGMGYLLARISDTLADSAAASVDDRLRWLDVFSRGVSGEGDPPRWSSRVVKTVTDPRERLLLEAGEELVKDLGLLPPQEIRLVRDVVEIIIGGQRLDLLRFGTADSEHPVALADDVELEDYAWRVAGCVGEFWTRLGFLTLGSGFSTKAPESLLEKGAAYGKGLQLVNILRDLSTDLAAGRCYLPVRDPLDKEELIHCHRRWKDRAGVWLEDGFDYAQTLRSRRLRAATVLPAMIGKATLDLMRGADWQDLQAKVKVPRGRVYQALIRACLGFGR